MTGRPTVTLFTAAADAFPRRPAFSRPLSSPALQGALAHGVPPRSATGSFIGVPASIGAERGVPAADRGEAANVVGRTSGVTRGGWTAGS